MNAYNYIRIYGLEASESEKFCGRGGSGASSQSPAQVSANMDALQEYIDDVQAWDDLALAVVDTFRANTLDYLQAADSGGLPVPSPSPLPVIPLPDVSLIGLIGAVNPVAGVAVALVRALVLGLRYMRQQQIDRVKLALETRAVKALEALVLSETEFDIQTDSVGRVVRAWLRSGVVQNISQ